MPSSQFIDYNHYPPRSIICTPCLSTAQVIDPRGKAKFDLVYNGVINKTSSYLLPVNISIYPRMDSGEPNRVIYADAPTNTTTSILLLRTSGTSSAQAWGNQASPRSQRHGSLSAANRDPSARDGVAEASAYHSDTRSASAPCARGASQFSLETDPWRRLLPHRAAAVISQ